MELVQNNMMETISMSQNLLMNCVNNEMPVGIHIHEHGMAVRYSTIIRDFSLETNGTYIESDCFELDINEDIVDMQYDEDENSIYLLFNDREIYIDLI